MDGEADCTAEDPAGGDNMYFFGHDRIFSGTAECQRGSGAPFDQGGIYRHDDGTSQFPVFFMSVQHPSGGLACQADQAVLCGESSVYPGGGVYDRLQYDLLQESGTCGPERVSSVVY